MMTNVPKSTHSRIARQWVSKSQLFASANAGEARFNRGLGWPLHVGTKN